MESLEAHLLTIGVFCFCRSDGAESPLLDDKEPSADKTTKVKYGELVILG